MGGGGSAHRALHGGHRLGYDARYPPNELLVGVLRWTLFLGGEGGNLNAPM